MTDRQQPPGTLANEPGKQPDALVDLYRDASAQDAGPGDAARSRVLTYAHAQVATRTQADAIAAPTPPVQPAPSLQTSFSGEPANDRRWLRQALGSLAALGLLGLLTLHHLDEPGAPQLDSPASTAQAPAPAAKPAPAAPQTEDSSASVAEYSAPAAVHHAEAEARANAQPPIVDGKVASTTAPVENAMPHARQGRGRAEAETDKQIAATAPVLEAMPAPAAAPPAAIARAPTQEARSTIHGKDAAPSPARSSGGAAAMAEIATPADMTAEAAAEATAKSSARAKVQAAKPVPICDEYMDANVQAEQARRIKVREEAKAAGKPLPEPAPVCRPFPKKLSTPEILPIDSR